jgi:hypothetical protein
MLTENDSIKLVMEYERNRTGKLPTNVSSTKRLGYDIDSGDRLIEVKKRAIKYPFVFLTVNELKFFQTNVKAHLYLVYEKEGKSMLKIFKREDVVFNCLPATPRYRFQLRKAVKEKAEEIEL